MKASELIVKCPENEGVEYIFSVPGEENMDLLHALLTSSIRFVLTRWKQMLRFGRPAFIGFNNPDLVKYAESFGANGFRIESTDQLAPTLRTALDSNKLSLIDCPVDGAKNLRLTQRLGMIPGLGKLPAGAPPAICRSAGLKKDCAK